MRVSGFIWTEKGARRVSFEIFGSEATGEIVEIRSVREALLKARDKEGRLNLVVCRDLVRDARMDEIPVPF